MARPICIPKPLAPRHSPNGRTKRAKSNDSLIAPLPDATRFNSILIPESPSFRFQLVCAIERELLVVFEVNTIRVSRPQDRDPHLSVGEDHRAFQRLLLMDRAEAVPIASGSEGDAVCRNQPIRCVCVYPIFREAPTRELRKVARSAGHPLNRIEFRLITSLRRAPDMGDETSPMLAAARSEHCNAQDESGVRQPTLPDHPTARWGGSPLRRMVTVLRSCHV